MKLKKLKSKIQHLPSKITNILRRRRISLRLKHLKSNIYKVGVVIAVLITVILGITLLPRPEAEAWYNDSWQYRKKLTIDSDQVSGSSAHENFPVLVSLSSDTNLSSNAQSDGDDILFTDKNGTQLDHEIESYSSGTLVAWVRIPSLSPSTDTDLFMYYGNPSASDQSNATGVWDSNYAGVWHLPEDPSGTAPQMLDSTSNDNDGTSNGSMTSGDQVSGQVNGSLDFDGTDDYVDVGDINTIDSASELTISLWMKANALSDYDGFVNKYLDGDNRTEFMLSGSSQAGSNDIQFHAYSGGATAAIWTTGDFISTGNWYHVVVVYNGSGSSNTDKVKMYIDGSQKELSSTGTFPTTLADHTTANFEIGRSKHVAGRDFNGQIDNVRVTSTARSSDWIITEYNNQNDPSTFFSTGHQQERTRGPAAYWKFDEGYGTTAQDDTSNNNDGTINGATWRDESMCISGKCLEFDGTDDYVSVTDDNVLDFSEAFSITAWVRGTDFSGINEVIVKGHGTDKSYAFAVTDSNLVISLSNDGSTWNNLTGDTTLSTNTWYHVTVVFDGGNTSVKLYIDGLLEKSTSSSVASLNNSAENLNIGRSTVNDFYFDGFIDQVKIYPYARTADEIKQDFISTGSVRGTSASFGSNSPLNGGPGGVLSDGLVGYWSLEDNVSGDAQTIVDKSGNGNDGTTNDGANDTGMDCTVGGQFGYGCDFDGSDDYIDIPDYRPNNDNFTFSVWFNLDSSVSATNDRFPILGNNQNGPFLGYNPASQQFFHLRQDGDGSQSMLWGTSENLADSNWHNTILVVNQQSLIAELFLDGTSLGEVTIEPGGYTHENGDLKAFGKDFASYWIGKLDEIRQYNRALSASEVQDLYKFAPGPVAYYNFDEGSGTSLQDRSGNGNTGTLGGDGAGSDVPSWGTGKYGKALSFDGGDYVSGSLSDAKDDNFSMMAWVKPQGEGIVLRIGAGSGAGYDFESRNGTWQIRRNNIGWFDSGVSVNTNEWTHVTVIRDNGTWSLYTNGVKSSLSETGDPNSPTDEFRIGYMEYTPHFNGLIDEVRIYNYARTQEQILEDMNAGHPAIGTPVGSSVLDLKFDEGYGTTANDSSPQDNDGTINGASWTNDGKFGKALSFDGTDDYVDVGAFDSLGSTTEDNPITFSAWAKIDSLANPVPFMATDGSTIADSFYFGVSSDDNFGLVLYDSSSTNKIGKLSQSTVSTGSWDHYLATYDGSGSEDGINVYINGAPIAMQSESQGTYTASAGNMGNWLIGARWRSDSFSAYLPGQIDETQVYPFELSEDQVKLLFNQGKQTVLGSTSTDSSGNPSNSSSRSYCIPGDTSTCDPPVAEWLFEENSGQTANDTSTNGNNGTLGSSSGSDSADPTWTYGHKTGAGLEFDGSDDYVDLGNDNEGILSETGDWTVNAWVKPGSLNDKIIFSQYTAGLGNGRTLLRISDTETDEFELFLGDDDSEPTARVISDINITIETWYFITATRNSNTFSLYVDGVLEDSITDTSTRNILQEGNVMGARANGSNYLVNLTGFFNGFIDQVRIYDYARTPAQIAWEYNKGKPVAHYKFDECEGTTAYSTNDPYDSRLDGTINIGASGTQTSAGTCSSGDSAHAWNNGNSGKINSSLNFDGTDDYVAVGDVNELDASTSFSVSAWFNRKGDNDGAGDASTIAGKWESGTSSGWFLEVKDSTSTNNIRFFIGGVSDTSLLGTETFENDTWYLVTAVYDGSNKYIYINGELDNSEATTGTPNTTNESFQIGYDTGSGGTDNYFHGQIDDVKIFNYALTTEQIKQIYNNGAISFE